MQIFKLNNFKRKKKSVLFNMQCIMDGELERLLRYLVKKVVFVPLRRSEIFCITTQYYKRRRINVSKMRKKFFIEIK